MESAVSGRSISSFSKQNQISGQLCKYTNVVKGKNVNDIQICVTNHELKKKHFLVFSQLFVCFC